MPAASCNGTRPSSRRASPALADYVHGKGLKIGIYEAPNTKTCAGIYGGYSRGVGSHGHETTDAQTFAVVGHRLPQVRQLHGAAAAGSPSMRDAL